MSSTDSHFDIIKTADGSNTILHKQIQATYHSVHGAIQESKFIYIEAGLNFAIKNLSQKLKVFELGFGTGLNALLAAIEAEKQSLDLHYTSIEKYPLPTDLHINLHFEKIINIPNENLFKSIYLCEWEKWHQISNHFSFKKIKQDILDYSFESNFDIVFYDAFAPENNPELWQKPILSHIYLHLNHGGILVTFCAKGTFKRLLKEIGFKVESLPGPVGKREITRAIKM